MSYSFIIWIIICILFVAYATLLVVAKIRSPFWFHQPIYHVYELYPKLMRQCAPYIKKHSLPRPGIFCVPSIVKTFAVQSSFSQCFPFVVKLLQGYYLDNTTHLYHMTVDRLVNQILTDPYSVISIYVGNRRIAPSYVNALDYTQILGTLTSRPMWMFCSRYSGQTREIHLLDHICVDGRMPRQERIVRNVIQTHVYNHAHLTGHHTGAHKTPVYIFKKEVDLCKGVVPLVQTKVYTFVLRKTPIQKLPLNYRLCILNKNHEQLWKAIYAKITAQFEIAVMTNMVSTLDWLTNERYSIFATVYKTPGAPESVHGVYIFEHTHISWEQPEMEVAPYMLRLAGSICFDDSPMNDPNKLYFFRGFLHSLRQMLCDSKIFGVLEIPQMSHNDWILSKWRTKYEMKNETDMAYYLYNMVYPRSPIMANRMMILG